ncbi:DegT/DnrJ/EryC1/StrS family aminotransferase [Rhodocaloribacter litoris]|uniref:DegT/DnrJ/EryC1/StrS family aminotransferase n=1 Tax=Rhodocaloribacter litoris TaxID=2558931 RepID=UPI001421298B|nr:DegT/DnrJ/EryC1/StrS family aminotransferase [Rhodocaloribacter litoris]QXD14333.1 DegT/DnrJ/EryC1/StrS family aminotransferase [Rhodocaloribacter litoris]
MRRLPLSRPDLGPQERRRLLAVLASGRLSLGPCLREFEERMARLCGVRHAVAVSSGTAALHLIVRGLGLGPGDEVVTTPFSFVASSNALLYEGIRPVFVDIDPATFNLDVGRVEDAITPRTRAILAVDVFGLPVDWPALTGLAGRHDLLLIDDACEALGASVGGRPVGSWGAAAAFGFYPNKQITTGEGGCITTDDDVLAARCRSMRNHGRDDDAVMAHVRLGYNYRMSELAAALGCAQLERLPDLLARRAALARCYAEALAPLTDDLILPADPPGTVRSWFVYVVRLRDHFAPEARDLLMARLRARGIACAPYFPAIHLQPYYRERFGFRPGTFPACEAASARTLALPFFTRLPDEAPARVAGALEACLSGLPRGRVSVHPNLPAS